MAKITDPSKLLPSAKSSTIKVGKTPSVKLSKKNLSLSKLLIGDKTSKQSLEVNNKLIKVEKFLKSDLVLDQKKAEKKRKEKEKQDFSEAEKKLETPKLKGFKFPSFAAPSLGFLDRVKRFIFFTALGWALPKILEVLPKLEGFAKIIGGVYNFAEGLFGKLFDGFMSLVKFGGDLKDKTLGFIATAKAGVGGNYQTEFDKLEKKFNDFVNISILAGVLSADIGLSAFDEYNKWRKKNAPEPGKPREGGKPPAGRPKVTQGRGGQKPTGKPRITGDVQKPPSWWNRIFKGPFAKLKGPLSKFAGAAVPGLGAVVGAADAKARFSAGDNIGGALASVSAGLDAITAALAITGVGAPAAAIFGVVSIGIDVILLIRDIVKTFFPFIPMFSRGGKVVRRYQGGGSTRGGRPVGGAPRRTLRNIGPRRKPFKVLPPKSQPGKDIGGEKQIRKLYPDPDKMMTMDEWNRAGGVGTYQQYLDDFKKKKKKPNPYKALTGTAKILKDIPLVGGLMGAAVDIALGQKPDKKVYQTIASGIGFFIDSLADQKVNKSMSSLMSQIKGFAGGGTVPSRELRGTTSGISSADLIAKILEPTIGQKVNEAINSIEKELKLKSGKDSGRDPGKKSPTVVPDTYDPGKTGSFPSGAYVGEPGDTDGQQTGLDMNLSGGIGTPIYAPRDLIYKSKGTDGNASVGLDGTSDVLGPSGSGFGFYGAYYFKDGNKEYEVLMGHFRDLPYRGSKDGDIIKKGTLLGYQGASGRTVGAGNQPYPHISLHLNGIGFQASNQELVNFADSLRKSGGTKAQPQVKPTTGSKKSGTSLASWYGPDFYGNQTADTTGKYILERDSLWVAHKSLPFGTKVKFTYNGKTLTLPVRDRGPFHGNREWDLTEAAADRLGMKSAGEVDIQYEVLGKQSGGLIAPSKLNRPIPNSFASYENYGQGMMIAIQPIQMIVEKPVPVSSGGNSMIAFPVFVGVNNSNDLDRA